MYLSYEAYQNMGGTLDEATFNDFEFEASSIIDWYTFGRLQKFTEYPESLTKCVYHIIKLLQEQDALSGMSSTSGGTSSDIIVKSIASQSNDGVSISYNILGAKDMLDNSNKEIENTVKRYLSYVVDSLGRKVLYRGIYPDE